MSATSAHCYRTPGYRAFVFSGVFQPRHGFLKGERMILKAQRGPSAHEIDYCCGHRKPPVVAGI
jgi:hypothetical protein